MMKMEDKKIFTTTNINDVKELLKIGIKPFDLKLTDYGIRYVYRNENNEFQIWRKIKLNRQQNK